MTTISFPGLSIEPFTLDCVAFTLFGKEVRWYGVIITLGMIVAICYCFYRSRRERFVSDDIIDVALFTIIFGVIGARLYYVLNSLDNYHSFYDVIAVWKGGLAIYGGIIAGGAAIIITCIVKKMSWRKFLDLTSPGVMFAQAMGRWGNFFNGEAYGYQVSESSPLYFLRMGLLPNVDSHTQMFFYHPTFLYESLWNIVGFVIINIFYKRKKFDGQVFTWYIMWYGFGRMFIEGLRTDSLYIGPFRISQLVAGFCVIAGLVINILAYIFINKGKFKPFEVTYYGKAENKNAIAEAECSRPFFSKREKKSDDADGKEERNDE